MQVPTMHCVLYDSHWAVHLSSIVFQAYMHVNDVPVYPINPTELCIYLLLSCTNTCRSALLYDSHWTVHLSCIVFQAYMHVHDVPVYPLTPTELCIYVLLSCTHTCRSPPCTVYSITPTGLCIYLVLSFRHTCTSTTCLCTLSLPVSCVFIFYYLAQIHAGPHHALCAL
jgi:hypothetical protein